MTGNFAFFVEQLRFFYVITANFAGRRLGVLVKKTPPRDADLLLTLDGTRRLALPFACGFLPANAARPGTLFLTPVETENVSVSIRYR